VRHGPNRTANTSISVPTPRDDTHDEAANKVAVESQAYTRAGTQLQYLRRIGRPKRLALHPSQYLCAPKFPRSPLVRCETRRPSCTFSIPRSYDLPGELLNRTLQCVVWHPFDLFTKDEAYALRQQSMTATRFILDLLLLIILIP
jgi:hypothetical protein